MAVISIVGTSGVGKSFLVTQLASLDCMPAFLEGEEGVIPQEVFTNIFAGDPVGRYAYFIERYNHNLSRARRISDLGLDAYVDGATLSPHAILLYEEPQYHEPIRDITKSMAGNESDVIVLLTASEEKIAQGLEVRGRSSEATAEALRRAIAIQGYFEAEAAKLDNAITVDRTGLDFKDEKQLRDIAAGIKDFLKR
ncbi:MAG TPA: hypothetical protein VEA36_00540 [Candidatus Paceibacterota bacterium]|nr:hypothetical protein [Candidatus Paceibacterota bacterium]